MTQFPHSKYRVQTENRADFRIAVLLGDEFLVEAVSVLIGAKSTETWTEVLHAPVPGRVIVFPAWLYHAVEPNTNPGSGEAAERIIVS